ncbi:MAG: nucleoside permease [Chitinophagaceae bacterium]
MKFSVRLQLSAMMFLNFLIWGFWFVTMGTYLSKSLSAKDTEIGLAYGTQAWGAIIAPFIIGMIADRFFAAQKILGVLHLVGAAILYYISTVNNFAEFYPALLGYMILFMPTLALVNAIALGQIHNAEKEFSLIRVFGTLGWIAAGLLLGYFEWEQSKALNNTFIAAAIISAILGVFSFFLPNTPPGKKDHQASFAEIIGLDALKLLANKNYLIFFLASMLICIPLAFYYQETNLFLNEIGVEKAAGKMSIGQMSETAFLFLMPLFFARFNVKKMLLIGMIAWALRYVFFAAGDAGSGMWLLYIGIALHGICYDFFFVTGQIYTDNKAGERIRSAAQGMITLATYGVGMLVGFWVAGNITEHYKLTEGGHDWAQIWRIPAIIAAIIAVLFSLLFKDNNKAMV